MTLQTEKQVIAIHILPNILRSKDRRNNAQDALEKLVAEPFIKYQD